MKESHGVGAFDAIAHALGEAAEFVGSGMLPALAEFWMVEELLVFKGSASVRVDDGVSKTQECLMYCEFWFEEYRMLWSDERDMVGIKIVDVVN